MKTIIIILAIFVVGCTHKLTNLEMDSDEAIIFMSLEVFNNEREQFGDYTLSINKSFWGSINALPDENNYIYLKIDTGYYKVSRITDNRITPFKSQKKMKLPDSLFEFHIPKTGIYFLGSIKIVGEFDSNFTLSQDNTLIDKLIEETKENSKACIKINNNYAQDILYFNKLFGSIEVKVLSVQSNFKDTCAIPLEYFNKTKQRKEEFEKETLTDPSEDNNSKLNNEKK